MEKTLELEYIKKQPKDSITTKVGKKKALKKRAKTKSSGLKSPGLKSPGLKSLDNLKKISFRSCSICRCLEKLEKKQKYLDLKVESTSFSLQLEHKLGSLGYDLCYSQKLGMKLSTCVHKTNTNTIADTDTNTRKHVRSRSKTRGLGDLILSKKRANPFDIVDKRRKMLEPRDVSLPTGHEVETYLNYVIDAGHEAQNKNLHIPTLDNSNHYLSTQTLLKNDNFTFLNHKTKINFDCSSEIQLELGLNFDVDSNSVYKHDGYMMHDWGCLGLRSGSCSVFGNYSSQDNKFFRDVCDACKMEECVCIHVDVSVSDVQRSSHSMFRGVAIPRECVSNVRFSPLRSLSGVATDMVGTQFEVPTLQSLSVRRERTLVERDLLCWPFAELRRALRLEGMERGGENECPNNCRSCKDLHHAEGVYNLRRNAITNARTFAQANMLARQSLARFEEPLMEFSRLGQSAQREFLMSLFSVRCRGVVTVRRDSDFCAALGDLVHERFRLCRAYHSVHQIVSHDKRLSSLEVNAQVEQVLLGEGVTLFNDWTNKNKPNKPNQNKKKK